MISAFSLLLLLITAAGLFVAVAAFVPDESRRKVEEQLGLQGVSSGQISPVVEMFRPLLRMVAPLVRGVQAQRYRDWIERQFVTAGLTGAMSADEFMAYKIVMAVIFWGLFVGLLCKIITHWDEPFAFDLGVIALGSFFPEIWIRGEVKRRQEEIRRNLPYVMDLLTLSVEAGLDFVAGLHKVVEKAKAGPLVEELAFFLREIQIGASRQQALRNLGYRCNMAEISSFSALLIQADILGASIGPVLRAQSDLIRTQRYQRAERQGAQAAQKILFPLILCIMPAVFVVIFGPIVLNFVYGSGVLGG
ncbi:MAG: type II secretion system F family protein [Pseudomonadota bacterium]